MDFWKNLNNDGSGAVYVPPKVGSAEGAKLNTFAKPVRGQRVKAGTPQATWGADQGLPTRTESAGAPSAVGGATWGSPLRSGAPGAGGTTGAPGKYDKTGAINTAVANGGQRPGAGAGAAAAGAPAGTGGTQSGPGILENWFNQRAGGTDPAWEYGIGRAQDGINNQFAAAGGYNSSGKFQGLSDMYANAVSQRQGQLDALAGGASGEHQGRLDSMFRTAGNLAGGQAGAASGYDMAAFSALSSAQQNQLQLALDRAGIDPKDSQAISNLAMSMFGNAATAAGNYKGQQR